jgi:hypothetical protein
MEPIVHNYFKYKSLSEQEQVEKEFNNLIDSDESDFIDSYDADDLFEN